MYKGVIEFLIENNIKFWENSNIASLNSLEIGCIARLVVFPSEIDSFCSVLHYLYKSNLKFHVIGGATNIVFPKNYDGVIVSSKNLNKIAINENFLTALCGSKVTDCAICAMENSLSGLEFLCGIPGSIGGAVYMNASAFDKSVSNVACESLVFDLERNEKILLRSDEHKFETKKSVFRECENLVLLYTKFSLQKSKREYIRSKMRHFSLKRITSQPLDLGSAGSAFKRPIGAYASKLIDEAGLKGMRVGEATVSEKHAGFIVNLGNATSKEIKLLIDTIKRRVFDGFGITLDEEIIFIE